MQLLKFSKYSPNQSGIKCTTTIKQIIILTIFHFLVLFKSFVVRVFTILPKLILLKYRILNDINNKNYIP